MSDIALNKIHFLIVEDNPGFLSKLIGLIESRKDFGEISAFSSGEAALKSDLSGINFLIIDFRLPGMDGIQFLGQKLVMNLNIPKLILTGFNAEDKIFLALKYGATGYLMKDEVDTINSVIDVLLTGGAHITSTIALRIAHYFRETGSERLEADYGLTKREKQILQELSSGLSPNRISDLFDISVLTVRQHIKNIYKKLQVSSQVELLKKINN